MATLKPRAGLRLTVEEFLELPDTYDRRKMELDEGELYIMPRPRKVHQDSQPPAEFRLRWHIENYLREFNEPPADVSHDFLVALSLEERVLYAPDLAIVLKEHESIIRDRMIEGAPDIVVEILSSDRGRDLVRKRQLYAAAGIPEYWIFDSLNETATLLELRGSEYVERATLGPSGTVTTPLLPGLEIPLADIFRNRRTVR